MERQVFGKYEHFENRDSLWKEVVEKLEKKAPYFTIRKTPGLKDSCHYLDIRLSDTGTIRQIYHRYLLGKNCDVLYKISCLSDSVGRETAFVRAFYNGFAPLDTGIHPSIFSNKARCLLEDYLSEDEAIHKEALAYITSSSFYNRPKLRATDFSLISRAISNNSYSEKETFIQPVFVDMLGDLQMDSAAWLLRDIYLAADDNYPIQMAAIKALARNSGQQSTKVLSDLLISETPFISPTDSKVFAMIFLDSNRNQSTLYQALLENMPEVYKDHIYAALSMYISLPDKNTHIDYSFALDDIIQRYRYELKKSRVTEQLSQLEKNKKESTGSSSRSYTSYSYSNLGLTAFGLLNSSALLTYYRLLLPYDSFDRISGLLEEANQLTTSHNVQPIQEARMKAGRALNENLIASLFGEPENLLSNYEFLLKIKRQDLLPDSLQHMEIFALRCLAKTSQTYQLDKDTIAQVRFETLDTKEGPMRLFYFRVNAYKDPKKTSAYKLSDPSYRIVAVGFLEDDANTFPIKTDFTDYATVDAPDKLEQAFSELHEAAEIAFRKRAKPSSGGNQYEYDDL